MHEDKYLNLLVDFCTLRSIRDGTNKKKIWWAFCDLNIWILVIKLKLALFGWAVVITAVLLLLSLPVLAGKSVLPALNLANCWKLF